MLPHHSQERDMIMQQQTLSDFFFVYCNPIIFFTTLTTIIAVLFMHIHPSTMGTYLFFPTSCKYAGLHVKLHELNYIAPNFEVKLDCNCRIIIKVIAM